MKLAYVSPMPPARTGIATYSSHLVPALARHGDVTVFTPTTDAAPLDGVPMVGFSSRPVALKEIARHDQVLYHVGNNPWFHSEIVSAARIFPGTVCLHDTVLYYLAAAGGRGALLAELALADPAHAHEHLAAIEAACPGGDLLRYPTPSRHPCTRGLLEWAPRIIVHNLHAKQALTALGYERPIDVVPLLHYPPEAEPNEATRASTRAALGIAPGEFVVGAFGFIGPTKRIESVLAALASLQAEQGLPPIRLLIVGDGDNLDAPIRDHRLASRVIRTGFVTDAQWSAYLGVVDVVANLRYPSHGESSASLIQAMLRGKPCLVTDDASFSDFPGDAVVKIAHGKGEVEAVARAISELARDADRRSVLSARAREHVRAAHDPDAVARQVIATLPPATPSAPAHEAFDAGAYLRNRVEKLTSL